MKNRLWFSANNASCESSETHCCVMTLVQEDVQTKTADERCRLQDCTDAKLHSVGTGYGPRMDSDLD